MADRTDVAGRFGGVDDEHFATMSSARPGRRPLSAVVRRQRLLLWISFGATVLSVGGMAASTLIKSPAQVAASTSPPKDALVTVPVERKVLKRTVIFRGSFRSSRTLTFTPRTMRAPDGSEGVSESELVITKKPVGAGEEIRPGMLLAEVSYRPVFALRGKVPALRDLAQGDSGPDIAQLQQGLAALGYGRGPDASGVFGAGTAGAVRRFYAHLGYPVPASGSASPPGKTDGQAAAGRGKGRTSKAVTVPRSEIMFIPAFPATTTHVAGGVGAKISGDLLTVTIGGLKLVGKMDPSAAGTVKAGQAAEVFAEESGKAYRATVSSIGKTVTPKGSDKGGGIPYMPVRITPRHPWSGESDGQEARITVTATASEGAVLAVPESAISAAADGRTSVTVVTAAGERRRVPVTAGMSADGYVAVTPAGAALREGDRVVVGR